MFSSKSRFLLFLNKNKLTKISSRKIGTSVPDLISFFKSKLRKDVIINLDKLVVEVIRIYGGNKLTVDPYKLVKKGSKIRKEVKSVMGNVSSIEKNMFAQASISFQERDYGIMRELIKKNNDKIIRNISLYLSSQKNYLKWFGYNTASTDNFKVTPMTGTSVIPMSNNYDVITWAISSIYLATEMFFVLSAYNFDKDNKKVEFISHYYVWQNRQMDNVTIPLFYQSNAENPCYIPDYYDRDVMSREILEDLLYICLNLILANRIVTETYNDGIKIENYDAVLENIIKDHCALHSESYELLISLRLCSYKYQSIETMQKFLDNV